MANPENPLERPLEGLIQKNRTTVRVAGRDYTLTGPDSEEHMHRVAGYVDRKMEELTLSTRMPANMVAVLAAMNVADELLKSQDENTHLRKEMMALQQQMAKLRAQGTGTRSAGRAKSTEAKTERTPKSGGAQ